MVLDGQLISHLANNEQHAVHYYNYGICQLLLNEGADALDSDQ